LQFILPAQLILNQLWKVLVAPLFSQVYRSTAFTATPHLQIYRYTAFTGLPLNRIYRSTVPPIYFAYIYFYNSKIFMRFLKLDMKFVLCTIFVLPVFFLLGQTPIDFTQENVYEPPLSSIQEIKATDFNKDGKIDFIVVDKFLTLDGFLYKILYIQNLGNHCDFAFDDEKILVDNEDNPIPISLFEVSDINSDGYEDFIIGLNTIAEDNLQIYLSDEKNNFSAFANYSIYMPNNNNVKHWFDKTDNNPFKDLYLFSAFEGNCKLEVLNFDKEGIVKNIIIDTFYFQDAIAYALYVSNFDQDHLKEVNIVFREVVTVPAAVKNIQYKINSNYHVTDSSSSKNESILYAPKILDIDLDGYDDVVSLNFYYKNVNGNLLKDEIQFSNSYAALFFKYDANEAYDMVAYNSFLVPNNKIDIQTNFNGLYFKDTIHAYPKAKNVLDMLEFDLIDLNGDAFPDIFTFSSISNSFATLQNDGLGNFDILENYW